MAWWTDIKTAYNSTLAIGGVPSSLDSFVVTESSVLRTNICAKKPAHRQSAKRQAVKKHTDFLKIPVSGAYRGFRRPGC
jgi:hypothetical protein